MKSKSQTVRLAFLFGLAVLSSAANVRHFGRGEREEGHIMGERLSLLLYGNIPNSKIKNFSPMVLVLVCLGKAGYYLATTALSF